MAGKSPTAGRLVVSKEAKACCLARFRWFLAAPGYLNYDAGLCCK
jgi:hypothetical protein